MAVLERPALLGREPELAAIDGLLDGIHDRGGSILIRGDAGIGKSALLDEAQARAVARGVAALRTAGAPSETKMLFQVQITVRAPHSVDKEEIRALSAAEVKLAKRLQREGKWLHIWRIAGKWANTSIFEVNDADELHDILSSLPLFPYMEIEVTALSRHPASIEVD